MTKPTLAIVVGAQRPAVRHFALSLVSRHFPGILIDASDGNPQRLLADKESYIVMGRCNWSLITAAQAAGYQVYVLHVVMESEEPRLDDDATGLVLRADFGFVHELSAETAKPRLQLAFEKGTLLKIASPVSDTITKLYAECVTV